MLTNQSKDTSNGIPFFDKVTVWDSQLYLKYAPLQVFSKVLLRFAAIYNTFLNILRTSIYQNTF